MNPHDVKNITTALIDPHPWNRKEFDRKLLDELLADVRVNGIETALQLREKPDGRFEIIKGERRWTVAKELGLEEVPANIAEKDDVNAFLTLLRDNLQRENLSPLQEAAGYQRLLTMSDADGEPFTPRKIADRLSRDYYTVLRRLKLVNLPAAARDALQDGRIAEFTAYLIGRLPSDALRKEVTKRVLSGWHDEYHVTGDPLNVAETKKLIAENFVSSVRKAEWDLGDITILSDACKRKFQFTGADGEANDGSCARCPHLARNNPEFADDLKTDGGRGKGNSVGIDPLTCTNPDCRAVKHLAHSERRMVELQKDGAVPLNKKDADKAFDQWGRLNTSANLVRLDERPGYDETGHWDEGKTPKWSEIVAEARKAGEKVTVQLVINPKTSELEQLVDRGEILKAARKVKPALFKGRAGSGDSEAAGPERKAELLKQKIAKDVTFAAFSDLRDRMSKKPLGIAEWQMVCDVALGHAGSDGLKWLATWLKIEKVPKAASGRDYHAPIMARLSGEGTVIGGYQVMSILALLATEVRWQETRGEDFERFADHFGVDLKAIESRVKADLAAPKRVKADDGSKKTGLPARAEIAAAQRERWKKLARPGTTAKPAKAAKAAKK